MFTRKYVVSVMFSAGMLGALAAPLPTVAADFNLSFGPPAVRVEVVPEQPRGYVYSPGYWNYENDNHVWVQGSSVREREGYAYTSPRWVERDGRWNLQGERWERSPR